jgi:hypothetical protein
LRVWIGFAAGTSLAFLVTLLLSDRMTPSQIEATWAVAMAVGYVNHGIWHGDKGVVLSSLLGAVVALISLALAPRFTPAGWIVFGCGLAATGFYTASRTSGHSRTHGFVGVYIALGGLIRLLSVYLPTSFYAVWMVWMVLVGLVFITVGAGLENPIMNLLGAAWILASVVSYTFYPEAMFLSVGAVFVVGIVANFLYLYRLLGRAPRIGELFSYSARALFLKGLKKPIDQYSVLAILIRNVGAEDVIQDLLSRLEPRCVPIVLLGPTAPTQLTVSGAAKIGWVTTVSRVAPVDYAVLPPEDPTAVSMFLAKLMAGLPRDAKPVILGDFLDNMIPHMDEGPFYKFYADLASAARLSGHTVVFIANADIHSEVEVNVVKRFADVIIENREREVRGRLLREIRVSNRVDDLYTGWERT